MNTGTGSVSLAAATQGFPPVCEDCSPVIASDGRVTNRVSLCRLHAQAGAMRDELKELVEFILKGDFGAHDNEQFVTQTRAILKATEP